MIGSSILTKTGGQENQEFFLNSIRFHKRELLLLSGSLYGSHRRTGGEGCVSCHIPGKYGLGTMEKSIPVKLQLC